MKDYLSTEHRVQFYKTYIQPHIDYCSTIWGGTSQYNLNRIYRLLIRAVKIIVNYQYDNIANSMDELKILNIYERIFLRKAKFMFKVSKSILPSYVNEMFSFRPFNETLQSLRSTGALDFYTPRPQKEIFKQSLIYSGPVIWNNLPDCRVSAGLKFTSDILSKQSKYCSDIWNFLGQFFRHSFYHHKGKLLSALLIMKSGVVLLPFRTVGAA